MNPEQFENSDRFYSTTARNFKCPCGRTYLSYPALYTHIKNKHDGQAPGEIEKPKVQSRPRGRPPISKKIQSSQKTQVNEESKERTGENTYKQDFQVIKDCLKQINVTQVISPQVYLDQGQAEENATIKIFQKFIDDDASNIRAEGQQIPIGSGLAQFFQAVHTLLPQSAIEKAKSEQVFLLFMLLLQYTIDVTNDRSVISTLSVESLIEYINPFMNEWIVDYAEHKKISNLWIMQRNNMTKIFHCFYSWLKLSQYTSFCIALIW